MKSLIKPVFKLFFLLMANVALSSKMSKIGLVEPGIWVEASKIRVDVRKWGKHLYLYRIG